jgi:hypothetical protein
MMCVTLKSVVPHKLKKINPQSLNPSRRSHVPNSPSGVPFLLTPL